MVGFLIVMSPEGGSGEPTPTPKETPQRQRNDREQRQSPPPPPKPGAPVVDYGDYKLNTEPTLPNFGAAPKTSNPYGLTLRDEPKKTLAEAWGLDLPSKNLDRYLSAEEKPGKEKSVIDKVLNHWGLEAAALVVAGYIIVRYGRGAGLQVAGKVFRAALTGTLSGASLATRIAGGGDQVKDQSVWFNKTSQAIAAGQMLAGVEERIAKRNATTIANVEKTYRAIENVPKAAKNTFEYAEKVLKARDVALAVRDLKSYGVSVDTKIRKPGGPTKVVRP